MMRTCFSMDPLTLDPRKNGDVISSTFLFMLYDGLTHHLPDGQIELSLAESVDISTDQCTYLFRLREAFWSDGHPITAADFEYTWKTSLDPEFPSTCPQLFYPIKNAEAAATGKISPDEIRVQALDERTLRVELQYPTPYFLSLLSFCNFFPIPRHIELQNGLLDSQPAASLVTSGPFHVAKWERKKEIELVKSPTYWDAANTTLDSLSIIITNNEYTTLEMFENDELDWVSLMLAAIPAPQMKRYLDDKKLSVHPRGGTAFTAFNLHRFPFNNEHIRKAFSLSIDREWIVKTATQLNEVPANRLIPPIMTRSDHSLLPSFDPKLAKFHLGQGLLELGIIKRESEPFDINSLSIRLFLSNLTLTYDARPSNRNIAAALQELWGKVLGFRVQLVQQDFKSQMEDISSGDFNMSLCYCLAHYNDPLNILERFKYQRLSRNFPKFESPQFITLLDQSAKEYDPKERDRLLVEAEAHLLEQTPIAPLYYLNYPILAKPWVMGVQLSPVGGLQFKRAKSAMQKVKKNFVAVS